MPERTRSITMIELIIAVALISVITIGFSSIELFSRYHVLTSERRAKLQNEVSYALEHMSKEIAKAIGNERVNGVNTVVRVGNAATPAWRIGGDDALWVYIDANENGQRETAAGTDYWKAYRFTGTTGVNANQIRYCPQCTNAPCANCNPAWNNNILSRQITAFIPSKPRVNPGTDDTLSDNFVEVGLTACWEPSQPVSPDNPSVTMINRIKMPSVSTN